MATLFIFSILRVLISNKIKVMKIYDVYEDGTATISFYPSTHLMRAMGFDNMYDLSERIEADAFDTFPSFDDKKIAQFDPESGGTMVYCATEEIAVKIQSVFEPYIQKGLDFLEEFDRMKIQLYK